MSLLQGERGSGEIVRSSHDETAMQLGNSTAIWQLKLDN